MKRLIAALCAGAFALAVMGCGTPTEAPKPPKPPTPPVEKPVTPPAEKPVTPPAEKPAPAPTTEEKK
jgi:hypothetical protein